MDKNVSPYFDDGVEQFNTKLYKEILFNPGVPLQARELTQIQTLINEQLKLNLDQIYRDGSVIAGCKFDVDVAGVQCAVSDGLLYWNGRVYKISEQTVAFNPVGEQKLGFQLVETVVDAAADSALNDPASGEPNYNLPGADRLKQEWQFCNITTGTPTPTSTVIELWVVQDAVLVQEDERSEYSLILDTLAKRTFDESGHYLVRGMQIRTEDAQTLAQQATQLRITLDPGLAYVKGYEVEFNYPHFVHVNKSQETEAYLNENITFSSGTNDYTLNELYAKQIDAVTGQVAVAEIRIDHSGGVGSSDLFTDADTATTYQNVDLSSVIVYATSGNPGGSAYTLTTDYLLSSANGGTIDWSPAGAEPTGSYYAKFEYTKAFTAPTDYTFETHPTIEDAYQISFTGTGDLPVNGSVFYVDYTYYLARTDLVSIDKEGTMIITEGVPARWTETLIPDENDEYLALGYVQIMPNIEASGARILNYNYKRQTMRDLFKLRNRVTDIEYNQAELALEADAKGGELPTNLKGIFVDSFETWKKVDVAHPDFNCALNNIDGELTKAINYVVSTINLANDSLSNVERKVEGGITYNALTETGTTVAIDLPFKTKPVNLNPYTFLKTPGSMNIVPRIDSWIDTEIINLQRTETVNTVLPTITNTTWWGWWSARRNTSTTDTRLVSTSVERTTEVNDTNIIRARQIPIAVSGRDWAENSRIDIYFDDVRVAATPTGGTTTVTDGQGTHLVVKSDNTFSCTITVPAETRTGEHVITVVDVDEELNADSLFISRGINRTITNRTITTRRTQTQTVNTIRRVWDGGGNGGGGGDPISQTFLFNRAKTFTAIDLRFKAKDPTVNAWMEIGFLTNGYPDQKKVFHRQIITPGEVSTSANGSVVTNIAFTKPIQIPTDTRFFITLGSTSNLWETYVGELGQQDLATQQIVTANPYVEGVFFQSSNNATWTAFQTMDLACKLYEGVFATSGTVTLENVTGLSVEKFRFDCEEVVPQGTDIKYYYSTNNGGTWTFFKPGDFVMLPSLATQLRIKYVMTGTGSITPMVDANSYNLLTQSYQTADDNYYISRTVIGVPAFNNVRLIYDAELPAGCSVVPQYSVDGGINWFACADSPVVTYGVDEGVNRYEFSRDITLDGLGPTKTSFRARIKLHNGGNAFITPVVKNLKWIMKNV